jgi:hypothetical protein
MIKMEKHDSNEESKGLIKYIEPITTEYVEFYDGDYKLKYFDCYENSILRFLHIMFRKSDNIDKTETFDFNKAHSLGMTNYSRLFKFFVKYPTIHYNESVYSVEKEYGQEIRNEFAQVVSCIPNCTYMRKSQYSANEKELNHFELDTHLHNLFIFMNHYFPKMNIPIAKNINEMSENYRNVRDKKYLKTFDNTFLTPKEVELLSYYETCMNNIGNQCSSPFYFRVRSVLKHNHVQKICNLDDYMNDGSYGNFEEKKFLYVKINVDFFCNTSSKKIYCWSLEECYDYDVSKTRIVFGHSEIELKTNHNIYCHKGKK